MWTRQQLIEELNRVDRLMQENGVVHTTGQYVVVSRIDGKDHLCLCSLGALYFYNNDKPKDSEDIRVNAEGWSRKTVGSGLMSTIMALNDGVKAVFLAPSTIIDNSDGIKTPAEVAQKLKEAWEK